MNDNMTHEHHLHYFLHKGKKTGEYIGQCKELPGVIAHSSTEDGIKDEMDKALDAYFDAFPKEHDKLVAEPVNEITMKEIIVTH